ncbi:MAG: FeoA family protein [Planctomycetota bacterium]|nr:FeoA family protein [Planctomycetota bacterium]
MNLDALKIGTEARLVKIGGERSFRRRLMELGLLPGTSVRIVRRADIGGVLEIEVRGCRVTVRQSEARELLVAADGTPG